MEPISTADLADWCGGTLTGGAGGGPVGPDVVIDSRRVTPGSLFVAIPGERVDGHDYVAGAAGSGAAAALVSREVDADLPQVLVDDTVAGLAVLARNVVEDAAAAGLCVVGVTGSSGKTSTKDLIAQVLAASGPTIAPVGSFNNEIGAPLTAVGVDRGTDFLVAEMGARGKGHIAFLCSITPPRIGAVLNVGSAHLGEFGSREGIAQAKGELVEALPADGWAVLNGDDDLVWGMRPRTKARIASFTLGVPAADADLRVWASDVRSDELQRFSFTVHADGFVTDSAPVQLQVLGEHNVSNALATVAVGLAAGLELPLVASSLGAATPRSPLRMQLDERTDGLAVLNDSYNANPESMHAALTSLGRMRRSGGRLVAVLGTMLELGDASAQAHREVGSAAHAAGVDELLAVGDFGADLLDGFAASGGQGRYFSSKDEAGAYLTQTVGPRDVVLVKASRGMALETIADQLLADRGGDR
ncbi:UDP-N-acetylmuramoyl-tripeptide--D-alanyl-D-alanine ligase [Nigerium massiliense]|uniref:UDP-N-acetylmuramoyl-tripeptide--D-alanyl-D- alanine ligase n=1 Tax=Nigerium massiliense TaxID=1522317 RepID=UPI00058F059D|nr:UDP-N-acetylmuramoyl-tripeptide--D-alanyl-D-alanine ligase [Nigerium massiliense]